MTTKAELTDSEISTALAEKLMVWTWDDSSEVWLEGNKPVCRGCAWDPAGDTYTAKECLIKLGDRLGSAVAAREVSYGIGLYDSDIHCEEHLPFSYYYPCETNWRSVYQLLTATPRQICLAILLALDEMEDSL